jgi:hypothetical protein
MSNGKYLKLRGAVVNTSSPSIYIHRERERDSEFVHIYVTYFMYIYFVLSFKYHVFNA